MIPQSDVAEEAGEERPVWRLAFFSRLEQRKGIKLFVDAVSHLNHSVLDKR